MTLFIDNRREFKLHDVFLLSKCFLSELELMWQDFENNGDVVQDKYSKRNHARDLRRQIFLNHLCKLTFRGIPLHIIFKLLEARYLRTCKFCQNLGNLDLEYLPMLASYGVTCPICETHYPAIYVEYPMTQIVSCQNSCYNSKTSKLFKH